MEKQNVASRKLRNLIINPGFQYRIIAYFSGLFVLTTLSLYLTSFLFFWRLEQKGLNVGIPEGHVFFRFLDNQRASFDSMFIGLALFNFGLLISVGFMISHRIAGPLYKLKRHLENLDSSSPHFQLRQKDFFRDLEPTINQLKEKLK